MFRDAIAPLKRCACFACFVIGHLLGLYLIGRFLLMSGHWQRVAAIVSAVITFEVSIFTCGTRRVRRCAATIAVQAQFQAPAAVWPKVWAAVAFV